MRDGVESERKTHQGRETVMIIEIGREECNKRNQDKKRKKENEISFY